MKNVNPTETKAWQKLTANYIEIKNTHKNHYLLMMLIEKINTQ